MIMKMMTVLGLSLLLFVGCKEDKNMEDYRRDQLQQSIARISSVSGNYSGPITSRVDGSSLGEATLKFKASTQVLAQNGTTTTQSVAVSGSLSIKGATTAELVFDEGFYDDISGVFQVTIPLDLGKISLSGIVHGDSWNGSIEVSGQPDYGGELNLLKNAPMPNTSSVEVGGTRLQQIRKMGYSYEGSYTAGGISSPIKLSFIDQDLLPAQNVYKLFSPVRNISVVLDLTDFELNFANALLDDKEGTLTAKDPNDQRGNPVRATLNCTKFEAPTGFGWNCTVQTKVTSLKVKLTAKK
jgi:uncharacterized protein YcfL